MSRDRQRWERVEALLDALEGLPGEERATHLAQACPDDPELRDEVLSLLTLESEAATYLEDFAQDLTQGVLDTPDLRGRRVGAYRLLRPIGRGGMGVVYEAARADGAFEQRVALKLLTAALAGTDARARFLAERRILASLEHPSIARILDGGLTEDGTPWFAMERVEGEPIDAYCDRRRLGIRERLELFLQVCDAVEHAHRRLVVHRDLKPANVLVTGDHKVKLLDFGIAKLVDAEDASEAAPTRTALRMMTPEYASPEQVRGEAVTTASDVYQLGLLLYELLTGHRPYLLRRRSVSEIERVICEQTPTRLSVAVVREETLKPVGGGSRFAVPTAGTEAGRFRDAGTAFRPEAAGAPLRGALPSGPHVSVRPAGRAREAGAAFRPEAAGLRAGRTVADSTPARNTVEAVCRARGSTPARLRRRLRGDLENIVAKSLSKEPERRYGSADRLAQDIRRHLEGLPVTARADTWIYRGRKYLERHALGAGATALALFIAIGMTAFYTARVRSEAAKAEQVSQFLTGLFRGADPREARGDELTARELLDRGVAQVDRELAGQPEIQATMSQVLGRTYLELGLYEPAERLLTRALELRRRRLGPEHAEVGETLGDLGLLRYRQGRYRQAVRDLNRSIRILDASGGDGSVLGDALSTLGQAHRDLGRHEASRAALERALVVHEWASGEDSEPVASILHNMGALLADRGAFESAEELYERVLAIYERELAADHPRVGYILMDLASVRLGLGKRAGLEAMYRRSVAIQRKAYGPVHTEVGIALNNLGHFLTVTGRHEEAIGVLERAIDVLSAAAGPEHPTLAYPLVTLADAHLAAGRPRQARSHYRGAVAIRRQTVGGRPFDRVLAHGLSKLARIEAEMGKAEAAERILDRALAVWRRAPGTLDPQLAATLLDFGRWLAEQRRCAEALPLLERTMRAEGAGSAAPSSATAGLLGRLSSHCPQARSNVGTYGP